MCVWGKVGREGEVWRQGWRQRAVKARGVRGDGAWGKGAGKQECG